MVKGNPASFQGQEVLQMTQNGVDLSVVRAYIEGSSAIQPPSAEEIIYLHEKGVPADLIAAMIRRGAQLQEQKPAAAVSAPAVSAPQPSAGMVEPAPSYAYSPPVTPSYAYTSPSFIYTTYPSYGYVYSSPYYSWWDNWDYPGYRYPSVWGGSRAWRYGYRPYNRFYSGFHSYPSYTHANSFRYFNRPGGSFSGNRFSGHFGGQRFVNSRPHSMVGPPRSGGFPIGGHRR